MSHYVVAGPLLVLMLCKLNLTLTKDTLNIIIFMYKITNVEMFNNNQHTMHAVTVVTNLILSDSQA